MPRKIPYSIANYEEIVTGGYHFVDKTRFIRDLEQYKIPVFLRPRRFGKSLWCSILECYYDVNRADRFQHLFGGTDIGRSPTPSHSSQFVLRFDFSKVIVAVGYAEIKFQFDQVCANSFRVFLARNRERLVGVDIDDLPGDASSALDRLMAEIAGRQLPPLHIIIDEYDNFTNQLLTARQDDVYRDLTTGDSFLRTFYKVIKAGVGDGSVARVFVTGVLPVTMQDLSGDFNIGQVITLKKHTLEILGFTQAELDTYVDQVFAEHDWPAELRTRVADDMHNHCNGYSLLPDAAHPLYNSALCNFYLNELVINDGEPPTEAIDPNLRADSEWLLHLAKSNPEIRAQLETLMYQGSLPVNRRMFSGTIDAGHFFSPAFLPLRLYYLGMLTFQDEYNLGAPNLAVKTLMVRPPGVTRVPRTAKIHEACDVSIHAMSPRISARSD